MKRPYLNPISRSEQVTGTFGGYCRRLVVPTGRFYDMQNMTADEYPVLAPRGKRGIPKPEMDMVAEALHGTDTLWSLRTDQSGVTKLYRGDKAIDTDGGTGGKPYELIPWAKKVLCSYVEGEGIVCTLPGDINNNGEVDLEDAQYALRIANRTYTSAGSDEEWERWVLAGDINGNGRIDFDDFRNISLLATKKITLPPQKGDRFELVMDESIANADKNANVNVKYNGSYYPVVKKGGEPLTYEDIGMQMPLTFDGTNFVLAERRGVLPRSIVSMGSYIVIFPDKVAYNTIYSDPNATNEQKKQTPWLNLEHTTVVFNSSEVKVSPCRLIDEEFADIEVTRADVAPASPKNGDYWYDTENKVLKQYSETDEQWISAATVYTRIEAAGIGKGFKEYDGVTLQMTDAEGETVYEELNGDTILWGVGDNYIVVTGIVESEVAESTQIAITVQRKVPDMDYVVEYGNRLWGCSSDNHEIYCSKLGDPTNWNCFMGVSTDSYAATIGTAGEFTGAATVGGYVLFFKEHAIHTVYGTKPANFQISTVNAPGIQAGCYLSAVVVDEVLYYKGVQGIYATTGTMPTFVSEDLGSGLYFDAIGGRFGRRYVVSMRDTDGGWHLFVYDPKVGLWHRQDATRMLATASIAEEMYYSEEYLVSDTETRYRIVSMGGSLGYAPRTEAAENATTEESVKWMVQTGYIESSTPEHLTVAQLRLRMKIETGSMVRIRMRYDDDWEWQDVWMSGRQQRRVFSLPLIPRRCGKMQMQIEGVGDCQIYAITMVMEQGSEVDGGL